MKPQLMETARAFRIPFGLRTRKLLIMAALPQVMAGLRIALAISLVLMVIGEFVGASKGLGFYIREKKESFAMAEAWGGTILTGILGYLLSALFLKFERWALRWHYQNDDTAGENA
jgi:ABC-type nitrate/sulfonate/bicarbonate transport system permease component